MKKSITAAILALLLSINSVLAENPPINKEILDIYFKNIPYSDQNIDLTELFKHKSSPNYRILTLNAPKTTNLPSKSVKKTLNSTQRWLFDPNVSFYGPGFYGKRTACGLAYTKTILGVAHRTLPCGTLVSFKYNGKTITVPVIDRGPYVKGRQWDLSGKLCMYLEHCFTGPLEYMIL